VRLSLETARLKIETCGRGVLPEARCTGNARELRALQTHPADLHGSIAPKQSHFLHHEPPRKTTIPYKIYGLYAAKAVWVHVARERTPRGTASARSVRLSLWLVGMVASPAPSGRPPQRFVARHGIAQRGPDMPRRTGEPQDFPVRRLQAGSSYCPLTCASATSISGRQRVSSIWLFISSAVDSWAQACWICPVWQDRGLQQQWQWARRGCRLRQHPNSCC
jgi:hypothetical protein